MEDRRDREEFSRRDIEFHRLTARDYDDRTTRVYGIYHRYSLGPFLDRLKAASEVRSALDMGCGTGVASVAMAARGFAVQAVDHSPDMLAIAREKAAAAGVGGLIDFRTGDVSRLDIADGTVDLVVTQGLLHHLDDMDPCIREMARVLRPGGHLYISEPCIDYTPLGRGLNLLATLVARLRRLPRGPETGEAPIRARDLLAHLDSVGLRHDEEYITHLPFVHRLLADGLRLRLTLTLSRPWRRSRGDVLFVTGNKPA